MNVEERQEASVPVEARVNLVTLAELAAFWESQGHLTNMSQMIAWSMDTLRDIVRANYAGVRKIESVSEAHRYLSEKGLYQRSKQNRSMKKIAMALGFESLRAEGIDPKDYAPAQMNTLHNKNSVRVSDDEMREAARRKIQEIRLAKRREQIEAKASAKE